MAGKTLPQTGCPEDFQLTERTLARVAERYPTIDIEKTLEKFVLNAEAKGWMYRNWQSAFINYCDNGNQYGGVFYKSGRAADPQWIPVLTEVKPYGFRDPQSHETPRSYRTEFELWKSREKKSAPNGTIDFANALRAVK